MSINSINKFLTYNIIWIIISIFSILLLFSPLLLNHGEFYVPIFDNLDSTVVWYKILVESGMIFTDNSTNIPNMMSGLPRSSYFGEFNMILWFYYFFEAPTAYIINEILIHLVAFFSMYIFLKKYIVQNKKYYQNIPIYVGALYFSMIPYWSGAGITIAILPLVTYSLINIKKRIDNKWDWLLLTLLPLYTSFLFFYMFYIIFAGIYLVWITLKYRQLNMRLFFAIFLMGILFLSTEYRLIYTMFIDSGFISHRIEFDIFYQENFLSMYRAAQGFFLSGHLSHIPGLQSYYVLPIIFISMLLSLVNKRFTTRESIIIWVLISFSFIMDTWSILLKQIYTMPIIVSLSLYIIIFTKKYKIIGLLMLFQISLTFLAALQQYNGVEYITQIFPILRELNITRMAFIQPFILTISLVYAILIFIKKLSFSHIFIVIFILLQITVSIKESFYQSHEKVKYASFQQYYAPKLFNKVKQKISESIRHIRIVSYGIEPAVALYNGFYTIDGYSVNYPLTYKHRFRNVISNYLNDEKNKKIKKMYDKWGAKVYILSTPATLEFYKKNIVVENPSFSIKALCNLNTNYILSSHSIRYSKDLSYIDKFKGEDNSWDIFLYKVKCL